MIWLIGNRGMLGSDVEQILESAGYSIIKSDRDVDISNLDALQNFVGGRHISWIINCAAYTAVDRAEDEKELCFKINSDGPHNIGILAREIGARCIHISTDYVFDGKKYTPYLEDDPVNPLGVYGKSKAEGEERLRAHCPESVIIRTAWLYGKNGNNFVYAMLRLMREKDELRVVNDQFGSPTWSMDLAGLIKKIIDTHDAPSGIYHYTNEGSISWYNFAEKIYEYAREIGILDKECVIYPITTEQYPTKAKRPAYSVLSKDKVKRVFNLHIPFWYESLKNFLLSIK